LIAKLGQGGRILLFPCVRWFIRRGFSRPLSLRCSTASVSTLLHTRREGDKQLPDMSEAKTTADVSIYQPGQGKREAVENVSLADALAQAKPNPWTRRMFKLYFFLLIAFLNSCINGYDGSLMGGINAMKTYQR